MYLLVSCALFYFISLKKIFKSTAIFLIIFLFLISAIRISAFLDSESGKSNKYEALQASLEDAQGSIWISSSLIAAESSKKISKLLYYPVFWHDFDKTLLESGNADFIFIDTCDLACRPFDRECEDSKREMINLFRQNFRQAYSVQGECQQYVFRK